MSSPQLIYALTWLVRDTFRQAVASRVFWIMLLFSGLFTVFCLGISIEGGDNLQPDKHFPEILDPATNQPYTGEARAWGHFNFLFGAFRVPLARDRAAGVHLIHVVLATWVAGAVGLLVTFIWTSGFLPDFLQPASASVVLAKPVPRWLFVVGKAVGVVLFVAFQATLFFLGTWLALGIKTGVWTYAYLWGLPLLVLHFAAIFSFSALLAVCTRSTVAAMLGTLLFWALCFLMNYARHAAHALPELSPTTPLPAATLLLIDVGYWILPKPADLIIILENGLNAQAHMATLSALPEFAKVQEMNQFDPALALFTSFLAGIVFLGIAGHQLESAEY